MKFFHLSFFAGMLIFAALQFNDRDSLLWISIYITAAILAIIVYLNLCQICSITWACLLIIYTIYLLIALAPGIFNYFEANAYSEIFFKMQDDKPYIEQAREALGLLIVLLYCIFIIVNTCLKQKRS